MKYFSKSDSAKYSSLYIHAVSPINIALVKYWGKLDEEYIIPTNSSLSMTVNSDDLRSETMVRLSPALPTDDPISLVLNGKPDKVTKRIQNVVAIVKQIAMDNKADLDLRFQSDEAEDH